LSKILPYIYFILAAIWLADGVRIFIEPQESYYIFMGYETSNAYGYLAFKLIIGFALIWAGMRRLKIAKEQ